MDFDGGVERPQRRGEPVSERLRADQSCLHELIAVLEPHPGGLRKWSVMRAIRARREKASRDVPLKFENDVERAFRKLCEGDPVRAENPHAPQALFYRPKDKAGEVWAVNMEHARAWLGQNG